jgi:hypothetical protein
MTRRAAHTQATAARTPHPHKQILRNLGQLSDFCPKSGHVFVCLGFGKAPTNQRFSHISGRLGRLGQKSAGYVRARILGGVGGGSLVCRRRVSALSAPRAPPSHLVSSFQWVVLSAFYMGFCPVLSRSALSAPTLITRNQHLGFFSFEITKSRK